MGVLYFDRGESFSIVKRVVSPGADNDMNERYRYEFALEN